MEVLVPITFFMSVAAVMILRPITKKLGGLVEAAAREKVAPQPADDPALARTALVLEHVLKRLDTIEERLDFTERLVGNRAQAQRLEGWTATGRPLRRTEALLEGDRAAG